MSDQSITTETDDDGAIERAAKKTALVTTKVLKGAKDGTKTAAVVTGQSTKRAALATGRGTKGFFRSIKDGVKEGVAEARQVDKA